LLARLSRYISTAAAAHDNASKQSPFCVQSVPLSCLPWSRFRLGA